LALAEEKTEAARQESQQTADDVDDLDVLQTPERLVEVKHQNKNCMCGVRYLSTRNLFHIYKDLTVFQIGNFRKLHAVVKANDVVA
jgi:hypothetical protein